MISPTPFTLSLCFALIFCLPIALLFNSTITTIITKKTLFSTTTSHPLLLPPPPPRPLPQDDQTLFHLAYSHANSNLLFSSPKKIAFMFLTTTPLPFAPLWELFFNTTQISSSSPPSTNLYNIYIHAHPNYSYTNPPFSGIFAHKIIHSKPTKRKTSSLISSARRLIANALLHDPANAMFALLSPSCIPLHSFNFTYTTLISSTKSFIEILNNQPGAKDRWAARGPDVMLPQVPLDSFRIGSQFFVLTRKHARLVVGDDLLWEKFNLPCVHDNVCYPEEHYFPTLLNMRDPLGCVPATLTHVDWRHRRSGGHPRTYKSLEIGSDLILALRRDTPRYGDHHDHGATNDSDSSKRRRHDPFLFSRKFNPDCLQPLMKIANDVIFKD